MTERKIEALNFNGETIYVEVAEVEQTGGGYEEVSATEEIINAGEKVRHTISALAATVQEALSKVSPNEWTMEVAIGFKGKAGIPFITEGEANGAVKVTAKWKRDG
jgi:hypothetical protein